MDVHLSGLGKRFQDEVLTGIDLELGPRQVVAVIGLNGAGKTTLLRCLAGVITPTSGRITWDGADSLRDDPERHRQMMFLPDTPIMIGEQTVLQHLALHLRAYGRDQVGESEVVTTLRELDLLDAYFKPLSRLSRGQRYKAALAALLLIRPQLWLLDEPFASGMDPQGMLALKRHARQAVGSGACLVYTTQIIEIAEKFCDLLLVIEHGRLAHRFTATQLRELPQEGPGSLAERLSAFAEKR